MRDAMKGALTLAGEIAARKEREKHEKAMYARGYRRGQANARRWHRIGLASVQAQFERKALEFASLQRMIESAEERIRHLEEQVRYWRAKADAFAPVHDGRRTPDLVTPPVVDETHE